MEGSRMKNEDKIGVYLCECGGEISDAIDLKELKSFTESRENVTFVKRFPVICSQSTRKQIQADISDSNIDRMVIAACSPKVYEKKFKRICEEGGLDPSFLQIANIREQCAWVHESKDTTEKAKKLVSTAIERVKLHEQPPVKEFEVQPSTVIVGGGITGMEAALTIADSGRRVSIIEKEASLGGRMKYLRKIFLGDISMCSSNCILRQRITSVRDHPNIEILLNTQIEEIERSGANFEFSLRRGGQFVDADKCTRCGECEDVCPQPREGMGKWGGSSRKAIYTPLPEEFKDAPTIDTTSCLHFTDDDCTKCQENCPEDAISLEETEMKREDVTGGSVLLATGAQLFDPAKVEAYGYEKYDNVLTAPECEFLSKPSGPTNGKIVTKDGEKPESIAILHCVGSRDPRYNDHCSNICCMYSLKIAKILREKLPEAEIYELYIDMRTADQGYEDLYQELQEQGVQFIRGKGAEINKSEEEDKLLVRCEDTRLGVIREIPTDLVVLGVGIEPKADSSQITEDLALQRTENGFYKSRHPKLSSVTTDIEGVFIAGDNEWPKDIPNALEQGDAAAAKILSYADDNQLKKIPAKLEIDEDSCSNCGLCVTVCPYSALSLNEDSVEVNELLCQNCGSCVSTCPTQSLSLFHSTDQQILTEVMTLNRDIKKR